MNKEDNRAILDTVKVPQEFEPIFKKAEECVGRYFSEQRNDPTQGTIEVDGERYVLIRAASMSVDFFDTVKNLYRGAGKEEAVNAAKSFLFDIAHAIGKADARNFHNRMNIDDPLEKLSAGPVYFAHSGWALVETSPESKPSPDENFYLLYDHPYSFEAESWVKSGKKGDFPVCIMNAGYSSGWCEESFGIPLVTVEILCKAKGDDVCRFIMAHPSKIEDYIARYLKKDPELAKKITKYETPGFFERKKIEDEQRCAEEALRAGEERFRMMFENMGNAVAVYELVNEGKDFIFKDLNRAGEKMDGVKREDLIGKNVLDVFPGVVEFGLFDVFQRVWRTGAPEHHPISLYKDEQIAGWRENYVYKLPSGEIVAIYDDVTEQKQMAESLAESEEKHRTLVETLTDLVFMIDLEGRFTYLSPIFEDITGYPVMDFIGQSFTEVIVPEYIESVVNRFKRGVSGEDIPLYEIELIHKGKKSVPVELHVTSLLNADGEIIGRTGTARDITKRKELEQQLQQAFDRLKASYEELSIPVIRVWDGVLVLPIIGVLDSERINRLMETMLAKIVETQSGVAIIDVTGVRSIDTNVANDLINVTNAAKLLGTKCVVTGIKPEAAHTLVGLGVDMSKITTKRSMQEGLKHALKIAGAGSGVDA